VRVDGTSDDDPKYEMTHNLNPLDGVLSHIFHIKYRSREIQLGTGKVPKISEVPSYKLHEQFLFFK
jgi:hypothetical protein